LEQTSDDSDDSDSASDSDDSASDSEEKEAAPSKKRKAEAEAAPVAKKQAKTESSGEEEGIKNLFVGNLSWSIDEEWLAREFEKFGEIIGARIITDRESGRPKGYDSFLSSSSVGTC
jgi:nucleolin